MTTAKKPQFPRTEIYKSEDGNLVINTYTFIIEAKDNNPSKEIPLVEISKKKRKWSDEIKKYYEANNIVTLTRDEFADVLTRNTLSV